MAQVAGKPYLSVMKENKENTEKKLTGVLVAEMKLDTGWFKNRKALYQIGASRYLVVVERNGKLVDSFEYPSLSYAEYGYSMVVF